MKKTGIIMSGNHPKLILDGVKTMTRRVIKLKGYSREIWGSCVPHNGETASLLGEPYLKVPYDPITDNAGNRITCPYGQVSDRLWVREAWRIESFMEGEPLLFGYKDGQTMEENEYSDTLDYESWYERVCIQSTEDAEKAFKQGLVRQDEGGMYRWDIGKSPCRWRPSIFMPRWASRITLEITEVRVERLQDIIQSDDDMRAEGIPLITYDNNKTDWGEMAVKFQDLWDSLNAKRGYGWETNPWVWVISFRRSEQ